MTEPDSTTHSPAASVDFSSYSQGNYSPGRGMLVRCLWAIFSLLIFESGWCPISKLKVALLRLFGAKIGSGVVIKPHVRIKFPWRLTLGDRVWIGQDAWIDNLAEVTIGSHVCLSQRVYLCTGSHNHRKSSFDLITEPIEIASGSWICAAAIILPGTQIGELAVISAGSVVQGRVEPTAIMRGHPAEKVAVRIIEDQSEVSNSSGQRLEKDDSART